MRILRLGALVAVLWGVFQQDRTARGAERLAVGVLAGASALGWLGWVAAGRADARNRASGPALALLAGAGGALAALTPIALTFAAVAALGAGIALEIGPAAFVAGLGAGSVVVAGAASGAPAGFMASGVLASLAGVLAGRSRRQYTMRAHQAELLLEERSRADAERDRATALAERNRIAGEIHDVLAHSLGALAVQLEAADAVLEDGAEPDRARELVQAARELAVHGLDEARQAVHALRDEPVALVERLESLARRDGAELALTGIPRTLGAPAGVALYRAAQEAITNARKHAPGAPVALHLDFAEQQTVITVTNGASEGPGDAMGLAGTGGGFGLAAMRERVELVGGTVAAGPDENGFTVRVAVPA